MRAFSYQSAKIRIFFEYAIYFFQSVAYISVRWQISAKGQYLHDWQPGFAMKGISGLRMSAMSSCSIFSKAAKCSGVSCSEPSHEAAMNGCCKFFSGWMPAIWGLLEGLL